MPPSDPPEEAADVSPDDLQDEPVDDEDTVSGGAQSRGGAPALAGAGRDGRGNLDHWPDDDDPLEDGWEEEWAVEPPRRAASGVDWSGLEVESFDALPAGRVLAGREEAFRVDGLGSELVPALLDTASPRSRLHAELAPGSGGGVNATFAGRTVPLMPRREGELAVVDVTVHIGAHRQAVALVLDREPSSRPLVLGVDALAGMVIVDPAATDLLSRG